MCIKTCSICIDPLYTEFQKGIITIKKGFIFSKNTIWSNHETSEYRYYENKIGKVIINDAVNISDVNDNQYDFVFSSHTLEHIANPLKAIKEWLRITKKDGYIIIVVPEKSCCFDYKRNYSKFIFYWLIA